MRELSGPAAPNALAEAVRGDEPWVWRGLVAHWPVVQAAQDAGVLPYLRRFVSGATVGAWFGPPEIDGRFDYLADFSGMNFMREMLPLEALIDTLERHADEARPPAIYMGSTTAETCAPGFREENTLDFSQPDALASLWLGNRIRVAAHQDLPDNLACVAAGQRRFTLLPPGEVANLYVGPLEYTLAGQPTSVVDLTQPDLARFPKAAAALERARVAELGPGDAIFIPSMWWHQVEALAPVNLLVNHWWRQSPAWMDSPMAALLTTIMTVRDLPPAQREAWRVLFDHYVFEADEHTAEHLPPAARQILAPLDETTARALRTRILRRLNR